MASLRVSAYKTLASKPAHPYALFPSLFNQQARSYATQQSLGGKGSSAAASRRQVTVANDDGRVRWRELSVREKAARTTQQSFNFLIVLTGIIMTGGVATYLYLDVFSSDSKTIHFNRAVNRVKKDRRCLDLLGPADQISASAFIEGEGGSRMFRSRAFASKEQTDRKGVEHLYMNIKVSGPKNSGLIRLHMTKRPDQKEHECASLVLDVKGRPQINLESAGEKNVAKKSSGKLFGVRWW